MARPFLGKLFAQKMLYAKYEVSSFTAFGNIFEDMPNFLRIV